MDDFSAAELPPKAKWVLARLDMARRIAGYQRLATLAACVLLAAAWLLVGAPMRSSAHFPGPPLDNGSIERPPQGEPHPQLHNGGGKQTLDVAVNPIGHCEQPPCEVKFEARVLGAAPGSVTLQWSGCASGTAATSVCPVDEQQAVLATVTATSKATGERVTASATAAPRMVTVFYGTNRQGERRSDGGVTFTGARNDDPLQPLSLGISTVAIPPGHLRGGMERPLKIWKFEQSEDVREHVLILEASPRTPEAFFADLHNRVEDSAARAAFIFVHGFRVAFDDAVRQTGQMAWDLKFPGVPILYSWPSAGKLAAYATDYDSARLSRVHFARFLQDLQQRSGATTLYVIAHSMGAWAVVNGLEELDRNATGPGSPHFKELIFAAPDVDQGEFQMAATRMKSRADRITLYAASQDVALDASSSLRSDYPRAGQAGARLLVLPNVDTIDASAVTNEGTSVLDHSYFDNTLSVLGDLSTLLTTATPAAQRYGLEGRRKGSQSYWVFVGGAFPFQWTRLATYGVIFLVVAALILVIAWICAYAFIRFARYYVYRQWGFRP